MSSSLEEKFGSLQEFQTKNPKIQVINWEEQAGAELCQAQDSLG